jgi:hypothetical protein
MHMVCWTSSNEHAYFYSHEKIILFVYWISNWSDQSINLTPHVINFEVSNELGVLAARGHYRVASVKNKFDVLLIGGNELRTTDAVILYI